MRANLASAGVELIRLCLQSSHLLQGLESRRRLHRSSCHHPSFAYFDMIQQVVGVMQESLDRVG